MESNFSRIRRTTCGAAITAVTVFSIAAASTINAPARASTDGDVTSSQEVVDHKTFQVDKVKVDAPPEAVWAVLTNYEDAPRVYSKVSTCHVVVDEGVNKQVAFKVKAFKDLVTLDYTLNIKENFPGSIEWSRRSGAFKANEGYWRMEPLDGGKTCLVTYAKFIDGGAMQYFVNKELKTDMPIILGSVKSTAEKYHQNSLQQNIAKHQPVGLNQTKKSTLTAEHETQVTTITLHGPLKSGL